MRELKNPTTEKECENLTQIIETVFKLNFDPTIKTKDFWYRGHSKAEYKLQPGIFRNKKLTENEVEINLQFLRDVFFLKKDFPDSVSDRLLYMQHYGLPTRLLDWTENLLVALYFATNNQGEDGELIIMNVLYLNCQIEKKRTSIYLVNDSFHRNIDKDSEVNEINKCFCRAFDLDFEHQIEKKRAWGCHFFKSDIRHFVQKSCFTIHSDETELNKEFIYNLVIKSEYKAQIKKDLAVLGIDQFSVFPDMENLAKSLVNKYKV